MEAIPVMWVIQVRAGTAYIFKRGDGFIIEDTGCDTLGSVPQQYVDCDHRWNNNRSQQKVFKSLVEAVKAINEAEKKDDITPAAVSKMINSLPRFSDAFPSD